MVSRLRPLNMELDFEDRPYGLGETINLRVTLVPGRDVDVREGRVDLVCEERWTETYTVMVSTRFGGGTRGAASSVPKVSSKQHRETYVHSSVAFLSDTRLESGGARTYNSRLEISPEPPAHTGPQREQAKVKWTLVASADVARGRDPKVRRPVKVNL